jgi:hypothetical protein
VIGKAISGDDLGMGPFNSFEILVEGAIIYLTK